MNNISHLVIYVCTNLKTGKIFTIKKKNKNNLDNYFIVYIDFFMQNIIYFSRTKYNHLIVKLYTLGKNYLNKKNIIIRVVTISDLIYSYF